MIFDTRRLQKGALQGRGRHACSHAHTIIIARRLLEKQNHIHHENMFLLENIQIVILAVVLPASPITNNEHPTSRPTAEAQNYGTKGEQTARLFSHLPLAWLLPCKCLNSLLYLLIPPHNRVYFKLEKNEHEFHHQN